MSLINEMAQSCAAITCPDGPLGAADVASASCNQTLLSQVKSIIMWHPTLGTAPTNWGTGILDTDFNIDNTDGTEVAQKQFFVKGSVSDPDEQEVEVNGFQKIVLSKTFTLSFEMYSDGEGDTDTYNFFRRLQCGSVKPQFIYETEGGMLYGKDGGLTPSKVTVNKVLEEGEDALEKWVGEIQWKAKLSPDRLISPLA